MDRLGGFDEVAPPELGIILCYTSEPKAVSHQDPSRAERYSRMIPVVVAAGDTLSGIAAQYGVSYQSIAAASGIANPNLIFAGETVEVPSGGGGTTSFTPTTPAWTPSPAPLQQEQQSVPQASPSQVSSVTSSGFSIPGAPQSLANCIAFRESTDGTNPAAGGNVFGIIPASGFNVAGDSLAQQEQVAGQIFATTGASAWSADGCPGT
jgi:murein DD-endopeptidase MepM/ murein hydrolase activator NlpD